MLKKLLLVMVAASLAACGGQNSTLPMLAKPASTSPGLIHVAPMVRTAIQPASAMTSRKPAGTVPAANWSQIPGSASSAVGSPDGSLWVLSDTPTGPDKYIWHYVSGNWTNISGLASHIALAPNGTLYAINSAGGTYAYSGGNWTALGGGAVGIAAVADNSIYVLSNAGGSADHAIWHNVGGTWSQVGGSASTIVASFDTASHTITNGTIAPGGFYVTNSAGYIYYGNTGGSYVALPGSAAQLAPAPGGLFALALPTNGSAVYYYDLVAQQWSAQSGSGVGISYAGSSLYVVSASGAIYTSSEPTSTPTPTPTPTPTSSPAYACDNNGFVTDQTNYVSGALTAKYIEVDVCGTVSQVLAAAHTSSGNHGYFYVTIPGSTPSAIEIVSNLDAMASGTNPPPPLASWPWVHVGDYVYVQGRYYYDTPRPGSAQGIDWTEGDTGSWPTKGWVVVNGTFYN